MGQKAIFWKLVKNWKIGILQNWVEESCTILDSLRQKCQNQNPLWNVCGEALNSTEWAKMQYFEKLSKIGKKEFYKTGRKSCVQYWVLSDKNVKTKIHCEMCVEKHLIQQNGPKRNILKKIVKHWKRGILQNWVEELCTVLGSLR